MASITENAGNAEPRPIIPALEPFYAFTREAFYPLIRVAVGGTLLVHGFGRATVPLAKAAAEMSKSGFDPGIVFATIALVNETLGAVCVILGLFTRFFAASIAIELALISVLFFHNGWAWARHGWEYVFLWGLIFFAIALRGGGPYSLDRKLGWEL